MEKLLKTPEWLEKGIVSAGMYEGLMFLRRRGSCPGLNCARVDDDEAFRSGFTEKFADQLAADGINLLILNFLKGFGMEAERDEQELTRQMIKYCHYRGIYIGAYIGETLFRETFFKEKPEAIDWICRKSDGSPVYYANSQTFRYRACRNNTDWQDYIISAVKKAVKEFKVDWIHFDNFFWSVPPGDCHCRVCREMFRSFLQKKFDKNELKRRFGFNCIDNVTPPESYGNYNVKDPIVQEWLLFRCHSLTEAFKRFSRTVHELNPACATELNCHSNSLTASAGLYGVDHSEILRYSHAFWDERAPLPKLLADNTAITRIRSYKLAEARNQKAMIYTTLQSWHENPEAYDNGLFLGEALTFGNSFLGAVNFVFYADEWQLPEKVKKYIKFFRKRPALFCRENGFPVVHIYRGTDSLLLDYSYSDYTTAAVEQTLVQGHVPYSLLLHNEIPEFHGRNILVLAGQSCLSSAVYSKILDYAEHGGKLLIIGECGKYDNWRRAYRRTLRYAIEQMNIPSAVCIEHVPGKDEPDDIIIDDWNWRTDELRLPANHREIIETVKKIYNAPFPVAVDAPEYILTEPVSTGDGISIHVLNYKKATEDNIEIKIADEVSLMPEKVQVFIPGTAKDAIVPESGKHSWRIFFKCSATYMCLFWKKARKRL
ncbi:MAG: DUF6259 domain-containing protein [Victivallaceae bacterium]|nr:DUF6259 domain-containing protein [Victivallaceae bacterium]